MQATEYMHRCWEKILGRGDWAVDATLGNAKDTAFLAQQVGNLGHVWAFEIQEAVVQKSRDFLAQANLIEQVTLVHASHEAILSHVPFWAHGKIKLVVFNLGYCPGADKSVTTQPSTTLAALRAAKQLLAPGGLISLMVYRGHACGLAEYQLLHNELSTWDPKCIQVKDFTQPGSRTLGPVGYLMGRADVVTS